MSQVHDLIIIHEAASADAAKTLLREIAIAFDLGAPGTMLMVDEEIVPLPLDAPVQPCYTMKTIAEALSFIGYESRLAMTRAVRPEDWTEIGVRASSRIRRNDDDKQLGDDGTDVRECILRVCRCLARLHPPTATQPTTPAIAPVVSSGD